MLEEREHMLEELLARKYHSIVIKYAETDYDERVGLSKDTK